MYKVEYDYVYNAVMAGSLDHFLSVLMQIVQ